MKSLSEALVAGKNVSQRFPYRVVRVYETSAGYWIRFDPVPLTAIDGLELRLVATYKNDRWLGDYSE